MQHYFVRIGSLGEIRLASALAPLDRGQRVVVRTPRGIEVAEIASPTRNPATLLSGQKANFRIIRPTTDNDERLLTRLRRYKGDAIDACRSRMSELGCEATLLDVDQLLDGGTLVMHFLGELTDTAQRIADEVSKEYESVVRSDELATLMTDGCGPECGTGEGCGSGGSCEGCSGAC